MRARTRAPADVPHRLAAHTGLSHRRRCAGTPHGAQPAPFTRIRTARRSRMTPKLFDAADKHDSSQPGQRVVPTRPNRNAAAPIAPQAGRATRTSGAAHADEANGGRATARRTMATAEAIEREVRVAYEARRRPAPPGVEAGAGCASVWDWFHDEAAAMDESPRASCRRAGPGASRWRSSLPACDWCWTGAGARASDDARARRSSRRGGIEAVPGRDRPGLVRPARD